MLSMMPVIGKNGIIGQRIIKIRLSAPTRIMMIVPAKSKIRREMKPIKRETNRSKNIWNLRSKEAVPEAEPAEIWR